MNGIKESSQIVSQVIGAQLRGTWAPYSQLQGVWSPSDSHDFFPPTSNPASHTHVQNTPDGGALDNIDGVAILPDRNNEFVHVLPGWYNVPSTNPNFPDKKVVIKYALKDTRDNGIAEAKYVIHLHDEWENPRYGNKPNRKYNTEYPVKDDGQVKYYHDNVSRKITGKIVHTWKVSVTGAFKRKDLFNLFPEAVTSIGGEYGGSKEFSVEETISRNITPGKHCYFYVNLHDEERHCLVDHFGITGFLGSEDVWVNDPRAGAYEAGFSQEYDIKDYKSRDHYDPGDRVDQDAEYKDLEVAT